MSDMKAFQEEVAKVARALGEALEGFNDPSKPAGELPRAPLCPPRMEPTGQHVGRELESWTRACYLAAPESVARDCYALAYAARQTLGVMILPDWTLTLGRVHLILHLRLFTPHAAAVDLTGAVEPESAASMFAAILADLAEGRMIPCLRPRAEIGA